MNFCITWDKVFLGQSTFWDSSSWGQPSNCNKKNVFYDPIWSNYVFVLMCQENTVVLGQTVLETVVYEPVYVPMMYSGTHWHSDSSYMFLFGDIVAFSTVRGAKFSVKLTLKDDVITDMVSCATSGDIVAVSTFYEGFVFCHLYCRNLCLHTG